MNAPGQPLNLLCAGAAQGLVKAIEPRWQAETGAMLNARFGAVGALKEMLAAGEPCDVMVLTDAMVDTLATAGRLDGATRRPLGRVRTGIAVRVGQDRPDIRTPEALAAALRAADAIHFPDPVRSTAGIHFAGVLRELGLDDALAARFMTHPNGATAMRALAASTARQPIGCTQVTEILYTPGVLLVGPLPDAFELATVYSAAISSRALDAELAERFVMLLTGSATLALRRVGGFED